MATSLPSEVISEKQGTHLPPERAARLLVMRGGGVKGLAFVGALEVLEQFYSFEAFAGTSAGAVTAVLLAAGLSAQELNVLLSETDFATFQDAPMLLAWLSLPFSGGLYPGEAIKVWLENVLRSKDYLQTGILELSRLKYRALLFAADHISGTVTFDSQGTNRDVPAPDAVRYSMSIPFFFRPVQFIGRRVYDGGMTKNFPIYAALDRVGEDTDFLALYLGSGRPSNKYHRWLPLELLDVWLNQDEYATLQKYPDRIIVIDTAPIGTTDFFLTKQEKQFLLAQGRSAALTFIHKYHGKLASLANVPSASEVKTAQLTAELAKQAALKVRASRKLRGILVSVIVACIIMAPAVLAVQKFLPVLQRDTRITLSFPAHRDPVHYHVKLMDEMDGLMVSDHADKYLFYDASVDYTRYPPWQGDELLIVAITDPSSYAGWIRAPDVIYREIIGFDAADLPRLKQLESAIDNAPSTAEKIVVLQKIFRASLMINGTEADLVQFSKEPFGFVLHFRNPLQHSPERSARYQLTARTFQPKVIKNFPFGISELFRNLDYRLDYSDASISDPEYFSAFLFDPQREVKVVHDKQNKVLVATSGLNWVYPGGGIALNWQ